jgi:hypothetical protein
VDYEQSLGAAYEQPHRSEVEIPVPVLEEYRFESLAEKIEPALLEMHRPIVRSQTATHAKVTVYPGNDRQRESPINRDTYSFLISSTDDDRPIEVRGRISSYNINTFKGRVYVDDERRPIPFEIADVARSSRIISQITSSLRLNARSRNSEEGDILMTVFPRRRRNGKIRSYLVVDVA